jgi:DNA-binding transcriptional ArsR family regulator
MARYRRAHQKGRVRPGRARSGLGGRRCGLLPILPVATENRAGHCDLRGHVALRSPSVVIDADVEPVTGRVESVHALSGTAGLEVATALLMEPAAGAAVRELARALGRSASTVSEVLASLRRAGLVDDRHRVEGTDLTLRRSQPRRRAPARSVRAKLARPARWARHAGRLRWLPSMAPVALSQSMNIGGTPALSATIWAECSRRRSPWLQSAVRATASTRRRRHALTPKD